MRLLFGLLMLLVGAVPAGAQTASDLYNALAASATVRANCPALVGARIINQGDRTTWTGDFASAPTQQCLQAVQVVANVLQPPPTFVTLTSTGTPSLNGLYAFDAATQQKIQAISIYVAVNNKFPAGQSTLPWPDVTGTFHSFPTTASWLAFASVMADFVTAYSLGQNPSNALTIP